MNLFELVDWSVALLPVLVMLVLFVWLDVFKLMTVWETLGLLALGMLTAVAAYPISGTFLDALPLGFSNYSRFVAPWVEELTKGLAVVGLFWFNRIGYKLDAVLSGFAIGAGFSVIDNSIDLMRFPELAAPVRLSCTARPARCSRRQRMNLRSARPAARLPTSTSTCCGSSPAT